MCPRRVYIKERTAFRGIIREVIFLLLLLLLFYFCHVLIQSDKKAEKNIGNILSRRHPAFPTKSLTSFKTAYLCKILNFLLRQRLIINPELIHVPLEKSRALVLPYSRMRIPIQRQNTLSSSLCLQSTVYKNFSYASMCIVRSSHMIPYFCWDYGICRKEKLTKLK